MFAGSKGGVIVDTVPRVMVVDDDPDIRVALEMCLDSEGYDVEACVDGKDALDRLGHGPCPEVIVLDLMMPRMNGFEVLEALRAETRWAGIPVVIVSANRGYSAEDLGVVSVLRKPFELDDLVGALQSVAPPVS
jgi:CheY-like chemotaxis protein